MKTLVTHSGTFHADDVFAAAAFLLAHPDEKWNIVRSRDKDVIANADAVIDVGGVYDPNNKRFDHHQTGGAGIRENNISYAAFGLIWKEYGAIICGGDFFIAKQIDDVLVASLDANDNGVSLYEKKYEVSPFELAHYIKVSNPTWKEDEEWGEKGDSKRLSIFLSLVDFASSLIQREIKRYKDKNEAFLLVEEIYKKSENKSIIIFDKFYPWQDVLVGFPEPLIAVYPSHGGEKWAAEMVPKERNSFESRILFPEVWAGKRDEELANITGVSDAIFCHNARFLAMATSKEGALELARLALK